MLAPVPEEHPTPKAALKIKEPATGGSTHRAKRSKAAITRFLSEEDLLAVRHGRDARDDARMRGPLTLRLTLRGNRMRPKKPRQETEHRVCLGGTPCRTRSRTGKGSERRR